MEGVRKGAAAEEKKKRRKTNAWESAQPAGRRGGRTASERPLWAGSQHLADLPRLAHHAMIGRVLSGRGARRRC